MNINRKLLYGLVLVLLSVISISYFFLKQTDDLSQQTENIYNHPLTVRRAIGDFKTQVLVMRVEFRNILVNTELDKILEAKKDHALAKQEANNQFDILYDRYLGDKEDIQLLQGSFSQWNRVQQDMINRHDINGGNYELINELKSVHLVASREEMMQNIEHIENYALNKADQFYNETIAINKKIKIQNSLFVLFAILIILMVVYILRRSISVPIRELLTMAEAIKSGNMKSRSELHSEDEFGRLASTFNEMAATIEEELSLNSKTMHLTALMSKSDQISDFCKSMLQSIMEEMNAQIGALYLVHADEQQCKAYCSYGIDTDKCPTFSSMNPVGEFAKAIKNKSTSHLKDVPKDHYMVFESVTGTFTPQDILTIPIYSNDELIALISIASIYAFTPFSLRVVDELLSVISFRISSVLLYKKVTEFNKSLQGKNHELDQQQREMQQMTNELVEQNTELEQQKYQLNEMNRLKSNFLSSMSHELRTPLNSVIALSGVLHRQLKNNVTAEQHDYISVIERNGKYLLNLINDILDLSRIESGKVEIEQTAFDINELVDEAIAMIEIQIQQKGLQLSRAISARALVINSDYDKCLHIVQNLLSNAVKFTEQGEVRLQIEERNDEICIAVSDTGIGISERELPHVFDEFRQADGGDSRKYGGTGLGLSIAKKYTQLLGGTIAVVSQPGEGSKFSFTLPIRLSEIVRKEVSKNTIDAEAIPVPKRNNIGRKILLVEDTKAISIQMVDVLEQAGYTVQVAKNGKEALTTLEHYSPDAMIIDLMMPEMNGMDLLKHIRNIEKYEQLPIMILTAKTVSQAELSEIKHNHVYQLIQKGSVSKEELLLQVEGLMDKDEKHHKEPTQYDSIKPVIKNDIINILTIEDNSDNRLALKALIGDACHLYEADNALDGIALAHHNPIDVILMDIAMPQLNGFDAFKQIRQDDKLKHIPIIVLTSSAMQGDKQTFLDYGFNAYVSKPIVPEELYAAINAWVKTSDEYAF